MWRACFAMVLVFAMQGVEASTLCILLPSNPKPVIAGSSGWEANMAVCLGVARKRWSVALGSCGVAGRFGTCRDGLG